MTVIRPNSISGITSITAQANEINVFRSDGTLAGLLLNGVNFNTTTGVSTFNNLDVGGVLTYQDVTNVDSVGIITARSTIDAQGAINLADSIIHTGDTNTKIRFPAADTFSVETSGAEALRIDSSGRLVVGATSSNNVGNFGGAALQVEGLNAATSAFSIIRHSADTVGSSILMGKTRGTSDGATTVVQSGDVVARIIAYGADGTDTESSLGAIQFDVDGTPGSNDMPGRIVFSTTPDGAATYTERLRITKDGNIEMGSSVGTGADFSLLDGMVINTNNGSAGLIINSSSSSHNAYMSFGYGSGSSTSHADQFSAYIGRVGDNTLILGTNNSPRVYLGSTGNLGIGTVNPVALTHIYDLTNTSTATEQFRISGGNRTADNIETGFRFFTESPSVNGNRHVRFTSNGNTGLTIQPYETSTGNAAVDRNILLCPSGGKLLIGRTSASHSSSTMEILGSGAEAYLRISPNTNTGTAAVVFGTADDHSTGGIYYNGSDDSLVLAGHNNDERFRISSSGNVGINHNTSGASTNAPLTIKNSTNSSATRFNLVNSGSSQTESTQIYSQNNALAFVAGANERFRITAGGDFYVGMTTTSTTTNNVNLEISSSRMLKIGSYYFGMVTGSGNNSNETLVLHKMGQNVGFQMSGSVTVNSYTGSAYLSGCIVAYYSTDGVTRDVSLQKASSGMNFQLVSGTISGESGTYLGIKKNGGGTGVFYVNGFFNGNIESYGGMRAISSSNWTTSTVHGSGIT